MTRRVLRSRGAVLVEFVVAIVPLLVTFFSFVQLAKIASARLMVKHAAIVGARAAAVIANGNDNTPDQKAGANVDQIEAGVRAALGPWDATMRKLEVTVVDRSNRDDPYGLVTVTVRADYGCRVPMGQLICLGKTKTLVETFSLPHQGARYRTDP